MNFSASATATNTSANRTQARVDTEKMRWEISAEFKSLLGTVLNSPGQAVTKSSLRAVTRHFLGGRTFYIKTYFHNATAFGPVKYFFKTPAARAEWQLAPQLQNLGIPVVPHLARAERWNWRGLQESILITEGPPGFVPLKSLESSARLQMALGKFLRRLHERAVFHSDLHASNLLYSEQTNEFCLVDLDNMQIVSSLSREQRMDALATLHRRFPLTSDFFGNYDPAFSTCSAEIEELAQRKHRAGIPRKLKLLFQSRAAFARKKAGGLTWHVRVHQQSDLLESILQKPDEFLERRAALLKDGTRSTVGCVDHLVLKRFNFKKISSVIFDLFRASRARHAFRIARHLELLKIPTPRPIACADRRRFGFVLQSYFVMEKVSNGAYPWKRPGDFRGRIRSLARLIAKMHNEGFSHRDLKETNILLDANDSPVLIDLDAMRHSRKISDARAALELARLARGFARRFPISDRDHVRFLKYYCQDRQIKNRRWWWNEIGKNLAARQNEK